jgi:preprotein translocase subunit SecE
LIILAVVLGALAALVFTFRATLLRWYEKAAAFLKEVRVEMEKVVWPSKQEVYGATFVVMVSVIAFTIAIGIEDRFLSTVLDLVLKLAAGRG